MPVSFTTPTGARAGVQGDSDIAMPEQVFQRGMKNNEKREKEQIAEADKFVKQKEAEVKMRFYKNTMNGIDDPAELMSFYQAQSQYYEATGRGDRAALSEQRGFLALERYQNKLDRAAKKGEGGADDTDFESRIKPDDFATAWDVLNTQLENLGRARDSGAIDPREYGAMMEQLLKEKQKLVQDNVIDVDDRNKLLSSENFFGTNPIEFEKDKLKIAEESPLGIDERESFKSDWDWWKDVRKAKDEMVWKQTFDDSGIAHWKPVTKNQLQEEEDIYLTHERFSRFMEEKDGNMTSVDNVAEAGKFYYQPKISRNDRGEAVGLSLYDQESGDTDVIPFTDQAKPLLEALNRGEIDDKKAMSLLAKPQSEAALEYFDEGISLAGLIEDDRLTQSWMNGGRWLGESQDGYNTRITKMKEDIAAGKLDNISISDDGKIMMSSDLPEVPDVNMEGEQKNFKETVLKSKWFSNEAAKDATRKEAERRVQENPDLFGEGPGQINPQQYVESEVQGSKALFGFLKPVAENKMQPSTKAGIALLGPVAGPVAAAGYRKFVAPSLPGTIRKAQAGLQEAAAQNAEIQAQIPGNFQQGRQEAERRLLQEKGKVPMGAGVAAGVANVVKEAFKSTSRKSFQNILNLFKR